MQCALRNCFFSLVKREFHNSLTLSFRHFISQSQPLFKTTLKLLTKPPQRFVWGGAGLSSIRHLKKEHQDYIEQHNFTTTCSAQKHRPVWRWYHRLLVAFPFASSLLAFGAYWFHRVSGDFYILGGLFAIGIISLLLGYILFEAIKRFLRSSGQFLFEKKKPNQRSMVTLPNVVKAKIEKLVENVFQPYVIQHYSGSCDRVHVEHTCLSYSPETDTIVVKAEFTTSQQYHGKQPHVLHDYTHSAAVIFKVSLSQLIATTNFTPNVFSNQLALPSDQLPILMIGQNNNIDPTKFSRVSDSQSFDVIYQWFPK